MYEIKFSDEAQNDLFEIEEFISRSNPDIAKKVVKNIIDFLKILTLFPKIGVLDGKYREIVEKNYKYQIKYRIEGKVIYIITVYKYKNN